MKIKTFKQFENRNNKEIIGPIKLNNINLVGHSYLLKTEKGTFKFDESEKDNLGITNLPKKGYNYVFEVDGNTIKRIIFYVVDLIIISENKILLIKRKNEPFSNHWAIPGGFVDVGEKPIEAAIRELEEETGLIVDENKLTFVGEYNEEWRDPRNKYVTSFAYVAKIDKIEDVKAMDDAIDADWKLMSEISILKMSFDHEDIINDAIKI